MGIFHTFVFQPIYNLIIFLVDVFPGADFGLSIVVATIIIKSLFIPLSRKQIESQKQMQEIQPKLKEIQERYKDDKERQSREVMAFYKESGVNPLMGCLPLVVQIIFLIAIYRVILNISDSGFVPDASVLYSFVSDPGSLSRSFHGVDLAAPSIVFAVLAAVGQFYQTKMLSGGKKEESPVKEVEKKSKKGKRSATSEVKEPDFATVMNKQMLYIGPAMTLFIGIQFPAALSLYWLVSTVFAIAQQYFVLRSGKNGVDAGKQEESEKKNPNR